MRIIAIEEKDIKTLMDRLELKDLSLCDEKERKERMFIESVHKFFKYEVINFFHEQGSSYPSK